jgi:hypothetical protein
LIIIFEAAIVRLPKSARRTSTKTWGFAQTIQKKKKNLKKTAQTLPDKKKVLTRNHLRCNNTFCLVYIIARKLSGLCGNVLHTDAGGPLLTHELPKYHTPPREVEGQVESRQLET